MCWVSLIVGTLLGAFVGGWRSFRLARQGNLHEAARALHRAALVAGLTGSLLTFPTLGWPFKEVAASVPEEVSRMVIQTVQVPVLVTKWFFWKTTKIETHSVEKEVKEIVYRTETRQEFSPWLLFPMLGIGCLCYILQIGMVRLLWRWFG